MMSNDIEYLAWAKSNATVRYNLVRSGIVPVTWRELAPPPEALEFYGNNGYGYEPLVARIADHYRMAPDQVVTTTGGASMANHLVYAALLQPGDEVLAEQPVYEPLIAVPRYLGATVRSFPRRRAAGYHLDEAALRESIGARTRLIVLSNLHNPTGVRLSSGDFQILTRVADAHGVRVLVDEAYLDLTYEAPPDSAIRHGGPFIVTSSLTKAYGLDGLRAGWVLCDVDLAEQLRRLQDFFGVLGVNLAERLAAYAFDHLTGLRARSRDLVEANRARVDAFMAAHTGLTWVRPDAGMICFPRLPAPQSQALCRHLRQYYDTAIAPGHFFASDDYHFRLSFGMASDLLQAGLANVARALKDLSLA